MAGRNKRHFRRYQKSAACVLKMRGGSVRAKAVDYSLEGIGAVIRGTVALEEGDEVAVVIGEQPSIETGGTVVWKQAQGQDMRIGLRSTGCLRGLIRDFRFTDTVIGLQRSGRTGVLTIQGGGATRQIFFRDGSMVFAASDRPEDTLGATLHRLGKLDSAAFGRFKAAMDSSPDKEGAVLVRLGLLTPQELVTAVRLHIEEIIKNLFAERDGSFTFEETALPTDGIVALNLSAADLIYAGVKRTVNVAEVEPQLLEGNNVVALTKDPHGLFSDIRFDYAGRRIVTCVEDGSTIAALIRNSGLDPSEALRTIYALVCVELLEVEEREAACTEAAADSGVEDRAEPSDVDAGMREEIERMHATYRELGYYGVLGIKKEDSLQSIKAAYYRAAKKFHPDIHFSVSDAAIRGKLSDIFSFIYEAYATLSNPDRRRQYDHATGAGPVSKTSNAEKAKSKLAEGLAHMRQGRMADAELCFGQAVYFDHTVPDYHYHYGVALIRQKKLRQAEKAISRALRIEPFNASYLTELGFVFLELGFPSRSRGLFEKALAARPGHGPAAAGLKRAAEMLAGR